MIKNIKKWFRKRKRQPDPWDDDAAFERDSRPPRARRGKKLKNVTLGSVLSHSLWFKRGLIVLGIFLLAEIAAQIAGLYIKPTYTPQTPKSSSRRAKVNRPTEDFNSIRNRNIFDFQGRIPPIFDPGDYGCFSEAKPSNKRVQLLGTIVMKREDLSVAIIDDGSGTPIAVKKGVSFGNNQFVAMEIERKRLCFQLGDTKVFEFVEIKDVGPGLGVTPQLSRGTRTTPGITITGENNVEVSKGFMDEKLKNLNEILQTARAIPNVDDKGNFTGFLIQSIQQDSLFYELGIRQGDVLTGVNEIELDSAGKGLEAFQALRDANAIALQVIRNGQKETLNFYVK